MIFAIVIYGCFLGWFRFFRVSNLFFAVNSFSTDERYPAFAGVLYLALYAICIILLFRPELLADLVNDTDRKSLLGFEISLSNLSYFVGGVIFGEACRAINEIEDDTTHQKGESDNFMDILKSLSPSYYSEGNYPSVLGDEACAAIEVSSWLYGIRSDVKRSLILAVSKEFNIPHYYRSEVLDYFNFQTGKNQAAKKALKSLAKKYGMGAPETIKFLEKIAKIGKRSGFAISDVRNGLNSVGSLLGIPEKTIHATIGRAERTSTDHDWRNFSEDHFWAQRYKRAQRQSQSQSQRTYSRQDYTRSNSSYHGNTSQSLNERQTSLKALGLTEGAAEKDIRSAYRKLAMKYHPDRVQADGGSEVDVENATEKMSVINRAYDWLCDNPA